MKAVFISIIFAGFTAALAFPGFSPRNTCPTCVASPNNCDITAPCANFVNVQYCACRPGYKAAQFADSDIDHQFRIDTIPGHEHRVWVAPGVACNDLCDDPWSPIQCSEVAVDNTCAPN